MEIRALGPSDIPELQSLGRQTFVETFEAHNTAQDMEQYLAESFSHTRLESELGNPGSRFFFACQQGRPLGYLKVNSGEAQTERLDGRGLEIERIYVLKEFLGRKVGQALYAKAMDLARSEGFAYLWLGVWEENHRALAFYRKNGFVAFDKHLFILGSDEQTDILMRLEL
jgi:diamine N-acetyltransferase